MGAERKEARCNTTDLKYKKPHQDCIWKSMGFVINSKDLLSYLMLCFPKPGRSNWCERLWEGWRERISPTRATGLQLVLSVCPCRNQPGVSCFPYFVWFFLKRQIFFQGLLCHKESTKTSKSFLVSAEPRQEVPALGVWMEHPSSRFLGAANPK